MPAIIILGMKIRSCFRLSSVLTLLVLILSSSVSLPGDQYERVRTFTRDIEFNFVSWTFEAVWGKLEQAVLGVYSYIEYQERPQLVLEYLSLVNDIRDKEAQLAYIYTNPEIADPLASSAAIRSELYQLYQQRHDLQPLAEAVLQEQLSTVIAELDLAIGGQTFPPVLFQTTPPPFALIVSPRDKIQQEANISILPEMTLDEIVELEAKVDQTLDVSTLVVSIGGIGLYPTMVMQSTDMNWLMETIAHEWVHNYLTLRPLGINYMTSPQLRTINETVAGMVGKELGQEVIERYYPELLPQSPQPSPDPDLAAVSESIEPPKFDFRSEMHTTRLTVDRLLAEGKIDVAEYYMELRRQIFWENGYHIRKLNQAYFAFHGAYADVPGGAAGSIEDPIGDAVRALRANSTSLAEFLKRISWMWSLEQLQAAVVDD